MAHKTLLAELHEEIRRHPARQVRYERELATLKVANQILAARLHAGLSQAALAKLIGTQQSGVARMENAGCTSYTTVTLAKIAAATGSRLDVRIVPARSRRPALTMAGSS